MRALLAIALIFMPAAASAAQEDARGRECFLSNDWRGWSAAPEGNALYLRMNNDDVFRVDLAPGSRVRERGGQFLVNQVRGSSWICNALDLDLAISDYNGFSRPLFPTELRKLTTEEVAALDAAEH
jgi:hypothetical protein